MEGHSPRWPRSPCAGPASGSGASAMCPRTTCPALLRSARAVVYPSLEEGFGLPALEALSCGAPLVTTAGTAMAELAGAALFSSRRVSRVALATPSKPP